MPKSVVSTQYANFSDEFVSKNIIKKQIVYNVTLNKLILRE